MKVFIAGGTGFLGYHSLLEFLKRGHSVTTLSLPDIRLGSWFPEEAKVLTGDVFEMPEQKLVKLMAGHDVLVYALGPDDRVTPKAPAYGYFHERLVKGSVKAVRAARMAGIRKCVVLGSYFAYFNRLWPELDLAGRHPYIKCRVLQEERVISEGKGKMEVIVLELPYIFGTMPERPPLWKDILIPHLNKPGAVWFTKGGSNMIAVEDVAMAVVGAAEKGGHGQRILVGDENLDWKEMIGLMLKGMGKRKKIVTIPTFLATLMGQRIKRNDARQGREKGLDPARLFKDIQSRQLYFDSQKGKKLLGYEGGHVQEAIERTARACMETREQENET
ncbi:MAG: NAD(P)H-binding protein [Clostridia bacterium]